MSDPAYRGRHRAPAGRHRAVSSSFRKDAQTSGLPRFAGSGYLLPTAAAATLVLTATGAHLGSAANGSPSSATSSSAAAMVTASGAATPDAINRDLEDRADRGAARNGSGLTGGGTDATPDAPEVAEDPRDATAARELGETAAAQAAAEAQAKADAQAKAQADAAASARTWKPPLDGGYTLTSGFGMRWGAMHPGQDFAVPIGTPVMSMSSGTVLFAGWQGGYGTKVEIQYWDGTVSWFAHNSKLLVRQGEKVTPGEVVSMSGNTGHSTGPHVHIEIHPGNGAAVSPVPWLNKLGIMP